MVMALVQIRSQLVIMRKLGWGHTGEKRGERGELRS